MAKQESVLKLRGTIDNMTFMQTRDGYIVQKKKRRVTRATLMTDSRYKRLRESMSEFGLCNKVAKQLRQAVTDLAQDYADKQMNRRLTSAMMKVVTSDPVNRRGERNVMNGDMSLMKDFSFNSNARLQDVFKKTLDHHIDRLSGRFVVEVPEFKPEEVISFPPSTTHVKFFFMALEINFDSGERIRKNHESLPIECGDLSVIPTETVTMELPPNSANPLFLLFGIRFYEKMNGNFYPFKNGAFNVLTILNTDSL